MRSAVAPPRMDPLVVLRSAGTGQVLQAKLSVSQPGDSYEQEADRVADAVLRMPDPSLSRQPAALGIQRKCSACEGEQRLQREPTADEDTAMDTDAARLAVERGGSPLPPDARRYFEPRFGYDFSAVRIHTDSQAASAARSVAARAYTLGSSVVFGAGQYAPETLTGRRLLAHELTHVVQQQGSTLSRKVELRPPGKGEYSAFDRRQELVDRLNAQSKAIQYHLDGRELKCTVKDQSALTKFDSRMAELLSEKVQTIPMRLITKEGRDRRHQAGKVNTTGPYAPVFLDTFVSGYVDLDDLLAGDDTSFKLSLIHVLAERAAVPNYAQRLGTDFKDGEFKKAHEKTRAEDDLQIIRNILGDPTLEHAKSGQDYSDPSDIRLIFRYSSLKGGYTVVHMYHHRYSDLSRGETFVETADGQRFTIEQFLKNRAAASAPPTPSAKP